MKIQYLILITLTSCSVPEVIDKNSTTIDSIHTTKDTIVKAKKHSTPTHIVSDSITMDDFPVTDSVIRNNLQEIQIDSIISYMSWFYNEKTKQVLLFEFATDYYRMDTYLFSEEYVKERIPNFLFQKKPNKKSSSVSEKDAEIYFPKFIARSKRINESFFTSNKGLKIGENIANIIKQYGKPDTIMHDKKIEIYRWKYRGEWNDWDTEAEIKADKKIAINSYGYQVILYVKNERIIGLHLFKEIP